MILYFLTDSSDCCSLPQCITADKEKAEKLAEKFDWEIEEKNLAECEKEADKISASFSRYCTINTHGAVVSEGNAFSGAQAVRGFCVGELTDPCGHLTRLGHTEADARANVLAAFPSALLEWQSGRGKELAMCERAKRCLQMAPDERWLRTKNLD